MPLATEHISLFLKVKTGSLSRKRILTETIILSAYTFLFLLVFQPFGTFEYRHPFKTLQLAGYGLLIMVLYPPFRIALQQLLQPDQKKYSLAWELLALFCSLLLLTLAAFLYHGWCIIGGISFSHLPVFLSYGLAIWSLPGFVFVYHHYRNLQQNYEFSPSSVADGTLTIKGTNQREHFLFTLASLYYLKSNGNYVMVYFEKDGVLRHEMLRNTLRQVSRQLPSSDFISIHRSFIVNHNNFERLIRADGKQLLIGRKFDLRLPVVSSYLPDLEKKLRDHR